MSEPMKELPLEQYLVDACWCENEDGCDGKGAKCIDEDGNFEPCDCDCHIERHGRYFGYPYFKAIEDQ